MKISATGSLLLAIGVFALTSCAPTMYVHTEGDSSVSLNKSALHYIVPPAATDSVQTKNLYPLVVNAFQINHIALTNSRKNATYLVTWGTEDQSKQVRTVEAVQDYPYGGGLNMNSYGPGTSPTGPNYVPVIRSYRMQNFKISIWRIEGGGKPVIAWTGSATAGAGDVKDPAPIINDIVARYDTNFKGNTQINAASPNN